MPGERVAFLDAAILDSAPDAAVVMDGDGRLVLANAAAERLFGFNREEAAGRTVAELMIPPPLREMHAAAIARVIDGGTPRILGQTMQFPALGRDGNEILVDCVVNRTQDDPPQFTAWLRERDGDRAQAARRQALLAAVEQLAEFGSWEWRPQTGELEWSDNLFRIFGVEPGSITPTVEYVLEHAHPDDVDWLERRAETLATSGQLVPLDYRIFRPDGSMRHLVTTHAISEWRGDRPHRMVGWTQDVTERRRADRQIAAHVAVADALALWDSLEHGGRGLLAGLGQAMDCVAGALWVPDEDKLSARVLWHDGAVQPLRFHALTRRIRLSAGSDVPGRAWQRREPVVLARIDGAAGTARQRAGAKEGLRGAVAIPVLAADDVLAVIELTSREEIDFGEHLLRSLTGIGHEVGQFLARRRGELDEPLLTAREREVLQLAAQGHSARQMAERLVLSPTTVRTHLDNVYGKLGTADKASAVAMALRLGLID